MTSSQSAVRSSQEQASPRAAGAPADCQLRTADWSALALIALTMLRVASTWTTFSATVDEPMHVSAGLQLYVQHANTYLPANPPLARLVFAFLPWRAGMDFDPHNRLEDQLLHVFYSDGRYETNLALARSGMLVFFVIAALAVWWWARRELGPRAGLIAVLLFAFQPMIAGHSGLATHDMPATAGVAVSLLAFSRWLGGRSMKSAAWFGAAYGFAILCKFSCIGFVPAACLAVYLVRRDWRVRTIVPAFLVALIASAFVVWLGYRFTTASFIGGIRQVMEFDRAGHFAFLFGEFSMHGWWWYFPACVALKTTLGSLALLFLTRGRGFEALAAAIAILLVAMPSHLDLGVRYVLPIYVPIAFAGAAAFIAMKRQWIAIAFVAWHAVASVIVHPDAIAYFNEAAGPQPWRLLLDSNLDWGQDVLRLRDVVRARRIDNIGLAVMGSHDWDQLGFPPHYEFRREIPTQGWIAISEHIYGFTPHPLWLDGRRYERIGQSIRLYYIP